MNWKSQKLLCADCAWPKLVIRQLYGTEQTYLRNLIVRLGLSSVDNVGELHGILDEEDGNVVSNDIPVTLLGVELDGKTTNIADCVSRTTAS